MWGPGDTCSAARRSNSIPLKNPEQITNLSNPMLKVAFVVKAWPNPSANNFNISITTENTSDKVDIQVMDMTGKRVHFDTFGGDQTYRYGENLQSGLYFVRVSQAGNSKNLRVIKK